MMQERDLVEGCRDVGVVAVEAEIDTAAHDLKMGVSAVQVKCE